MRLETFFEKFEQFADAPGAVAKMRELVLELAVKGLLVERKERDGSAVHIFPDGLTQEAAPRYEVASNWIWIHFKSVGKQRLGKMLDQKGNRGELKPYLRNTNVQWMRFQLDDIKELRLESSELEEYRLLAGDLLICEGGEPGRCAIWRDPVREMYFQKAIHRVRPRKGILSEYLAICLKVDAQNGVLAKHFTGATIKHLTGRSLSEYSIPLPPLAEQKRIVAKVDELMALCDGLEAQQQERESQHAALARAALARFADAPTPANLDFIFHPSYTITPADLRKSILTLAVQGKLVPQDPDDEPSPNLIIRSQAERRQLLEAGLLKRVKALEKEGGSDEFLDLPPDWTVCCLDDIALKITDGEHATPVREDSGHYLLSARNVRDGFIDVTDVDYVGTAEFERIRKRCDPNLGDILLSCSGSVGRVAVVDADNKYAMVRSAALIKHSQANVDSHYLALALRSPPLQRQIERRSKQSAQANLFIEPIRRLAVPLPPLAEQRRIVAKVDQLMALVDELEAQLAASRATATNLLSALVAELTAPANADS